MSREGCGEAEGVRRNWGDNCVVKTKREFSWKWSWASTLQRNQVRKGLFSTPFWKHVQGRVRARIRNGWGGYSKRGLRKTRRSECKREMRKWNNVESAYKLFDSSCAKQQFQVVYTLCHPRKAQYFILGFVDYGDKITQIAQGREDRIWT